MGIRKQRATTSMTYAFDMDYNKALKQAKRIHKDEGLFYIGLVDTTYSSYSKFDLEIHPNTSVNEKWVFENSRWRREDL